MRPPASARSRQAAALALPAGAGHADNARVQEFTASGQFVRAWPAANGGGIAAGANDDLYVVGGSTITQYSVTGSTIRSWQIDPGVGGSNPGGYCVATDSDGRVYASADGRIYRFTATGDSLGALDVRGSIHPKTLNGRTYAQCLTVAADGRIVLTIQDSQEAYVFAADGTLLATMTTPRPFGVAMRGDGSIFVAEVSAKSVSRYSASGASLGSVPANDDAHSEIVFAPLAINGDGVLYAGDGEHNRIYMIDTAHPTAALSGPQNSGVPGLPVTFDASGSAVTLGSIAKYEWDLDGDGTYETDTGATATASHTYDRRTNLTVGVRVTSDLGQTATAALPIAIGPVGVSINRGAQFTNRPRVTVSAVWPAGAASMVLANDGGFASPLAGPVVATTRWKLDSSGPERLPKTVYVRFAGGTAGNETYQDDIILDQTAPAIRSATAGPAKARRAAKAGRFVLRLRARDATSGLARLQVAKRRSKPAPRQRYASVVRLASRPRYVRVFDGAGNASPWKTVSAGTSFRGRGGG